LPTPTLATRTGLSDFSIARPVASAHRAQATPHAFYSRLVFLWAAQYLSPAARRGAGSPKSAYYERVFGKDGEKDAELATEATARNLDRLK
jgi:hypothetical protein